MSVTLTGNEGYFTRQGKIVGEYNRVADLYGPDLTDGFQGIWSQFVSSDQAAVQNLPDVVSNYRLSGQSYQATLQSDGSLASLLQVSRDTSVVPATLQQSFVMLIQQMVTASASIQKATIGSSVTPWGSNDGDATVAISTANQYGQQIDAIFPETIRVTCTAASTAFQETLSAVGEATVPTNSYLWPGGSGANVQFSILNPATSGIVTDGNFTTWEGTGDNDPTNWDIVDGAAGVTVFKESSGGVRVGSNAAKLLSDGSQATQLAQTVTLAINTVYMITVQAKVSASDGSGTLVMQVTDGDGNVLSDDQGNSLTYTRNMSAQVTTSYQCFTFFFSTPRQLPTTTKIEIGFGTAPTSGKSLFLSLAGVVAGTRLYTGGPFIAAVSGSNRTAVGDRYDAVYTNSLTSQSFAVGMNRLYNTLSLGQYFPSANSPTISDSLVTH